MRTAQGCKCGKRMFLTEAGLCFWCGRGECVMTMPRQAARLRRLPRDLGAFQREGRRPDPHLDNVVRLDRLRRDRWKVPPVPTIEFDEVEPVVTGVMTVPGARLTSQQSRILSYFSAGMSREQVANALGLTTNGLNGHISNMYARLGIAASTGPGGGGAMDAAVAWWRRQHDWTLAA